MAGQEVLLTLEDGRSGPRKALSHDSAASASSERRGRISAEITTSRRGALRYALKEKEAIKTRQT